MLSECRLPNGGYIVDLGYIPVAHPTTQHTFTVIISAKGEITVRQGQ